MDLEELNKTQIILLTLLVSFVSAIATSIFTVKILEQAPPAITQTINRIVERTIERVVPAEPGELRASGATVIEKITTVVVKEDDLITESIENNKATLARLVLVDLEKLALIEAESIETEEGAEKKATTTEPVIEMSPTFVGMGVFVQRDGLIATLSEFLHDENLAIVTNDGTIHRIEIVNIDSETDIGFVRLIDSRAAQFESVRFADPTAFKLGQTVISLAGEKRTNVSLGIVSSLIEQTVEIGESLTPVIGIIATNIVNVVPGEPLINIFGELVGIGLAGNVPGLYVSSIMLERGITDVNNTDASETSEGVTSEVESKTISG